MNLDNIIEYDGIWHKEDKDGNCESFTMADLKELLAEQRKELEKKITSIPKMSTEILAQILTILKE